MYFTTFGGRGGMAQVLSCDSLSVTFQRVVRGTNLDLWNTSTAQIDLQHRWWWVDSFALFMSAGVEWRRRGDTL